MRDKTHSIVYFDDRLSAFTVYYVLMISRMMQYVWREAPRIKFYII